MILVDSCGWMEYFAGTDKAGHFAAAIEEDEGPLVPTICLYEVFKSIRRQRGETEALRAIAYMFRGRVVPLDGRIALDAASISGDEGIPMADSIILATGRSYGAPVHTLDAHFSGKAGARYFG